jgi:alkaline phosphatase D
MLGSSQESWLAHELKRNAPASIWQMVGMGTIIGRTLMDRWDGYPAARSRLLRAAQQANADLVMLSGDSHNAWAYSLAEDGQPAGVEFAGHSVTSRGIEAELGADPKDVAGAFVATNPEMVWADTSQRGYMMIDMTPQRVTGEWLFMRTISSRSTVLAGAHRIAAERGRRKLSV